MDRSHLNAIESRLVRESARLAQATTDAERAQRTVWVAQALKEIAAERAFLGLPAEPVAVDKSDEDLLADLGL